jgi:hypothetical protein
MHSLFNAGSQPYVQMHLMIDHGNGPQWYRNRNLPPNASTSISTF